MSQLDLLARFKKSLLASRALQEIKLKEGVEGIDRYVGDVEGDWLENWYDEESNKGLKSTSNLEKDL